MGSILEELAEYPHLRFAASEDDTVFEKCASHLQDGMSTLRDFMVLPTGRWNRGRVPGTLSAV